MFLRPGLQRDGVSMSDAARPKPKRRRGSLGQTIGGMLVGFEQQIMRTTPPAEELVRHARPDEPVPSADGSRVMITMPGDGYFPEDQVATHPDEADQ